MPEHGSVKHVKKHELEQLLALVSKTESVPDGAASQEALSSFTELLGGSAALIARFDKPYVADVQEGVRTGPCVTQNGFQAEQLRRSICDAMPECPAWERLLEACNCSERDRAQVFTRSALVADEEWYSLDVVRSHYAGQGLDRFLCVVRYLTRRQQYGALVVYRAEGAGRFTPRERELAQMFWSTVGWLLVMDGDNSAARRAGGDGAEMAGSEQERQLMASLPPRLRQVLLMLLRGYTADMMAGELGLSVHTVYEHMRRLYGRVGVSHRTALIARLRGTDLGKNGCEEGVAHAGPGAAKEPPVAEVSAEVGNRKRPPRTGSRRR